MTNKTVTMSRELVEQLQRSAESMGWSVADDLSAALAAPVVERQPFFYGIMQPDGKPHYSELCVSGEASDLESEAESMSEDSDGEYHVVALYTAPPELAELQATIARLTAENENNAKNSKSWEESAMYWMDERDKLKYEIERLKGGQGGPVAWKCTGDIGTPHVTDSEDCANAWYSHGGTVERLYASQPAPVSVPEGWKLVPIVPTETMLNVLHDRVLISVNSRKKEANILNDKAWWKAVVESAPDCLDKVKELNG